MRFEKRLSYAQDIRLFKHRSTLAWYLVLIFTIMILPLLLDLYWTSLMILIGINIIVALGLNLLTGYTGQISLGHAAFFAIGAYSSAILTGRMELPFLLALPLSGILTALSGIIIGLPALRLKGLYLGIVTMGFGFIVEEVLIRWESVTNGINGMAVSRPVVGPIDFTEDESYYYIVYISVILLVVLLKNILRSPTGRAFIAIRDSEIAAESMGINLAKYKTLSFCISAFYTGIAGSLFAHFMFFIGPESFNFLVSITFLVMILIGGLGSIHGAVFGAIIITMLPELIGLVKDYLPAEIAGRAGLQAAVLGLILILIIRFEPLGLYGRWLKIKFYFDNFPFYKKNTFKRVRNFYRIEKN